MKNDFLSRFFKKVFRKLREKEKLEITPKPVLETRKPAPKPRRERYVYTSGTGLFKCRIFTPRKTFFFEERHRVHVTGKWKNYNEVARAVMEKHDRDPEFAGHIIVSFKLLNVSTGVHKRRFKVVKRQPTYVKAFEILMEGSEEGREE